jgi:hypothetical protein
MFKDMNNTFKPRHAEHDKDSFPSVDGKHYCGCLSFSINTVGRVCTLHTVNGIDSFSTELSRYSDWNMGWRAEESGFDSGQVLHPDRLWDPPSLLPGA